MNVPWHILAPHIKKGISILRLTLPFHPLKKYSIENDLELVFNLNDLTLIVAAASLAYSVRHH